MLNVESTETMKMYTVWRANCLPGQILGVMSTVIRHHGRCEQYLLPPPRPEYPVLRVIYQGVYFSILQEPIWVEGFRVVVDCWIV